MGMCMAFSSNAAMGIPKSIAAHECSSLCVNEYPFFFHYVIKFEYGIILEYY
jgi:hypothetical protein